MSEFTGSISGTRPLQIRTAVGTAEAVEAAAVDAPGAGQAKLEIQNLNFYYGKFQALRNISVKMPARRITSIIGPSGTGKSTFLRLFNRMSDLVPGTHVEGQVWLDGQNIFEGLDPVKLRSRVGMVFQKPNPFPKSIYDNIAYGPRMHGVKNKK